MDLEVIKGLPAEWYIAQPIPWQLINDMGKLPLVPEWDIAYFMKFGRRNRSFRMLEVIICAAKGMTVTQTAHHLHVSRSTIQTHRRRAVYMFGATNMIEVVAKAIALGFIKPVLP